MIGLLNLPSPPPGRPGQGGEVGQVLGDGGSLRRHGPPAPAGLRDPNGGPGLHPRGGDLPVPGPPGEHVPRAPGWVN